MSHFRCAVTLLAGLGLVAGCQLQASLNGKKLAGSSGSSDTSKSSSNGGSGGAGGADRGTDAAGSGEVSVELWDDGMSDVDMDAKVVEVECTPAKENAECNGLDDDCDGQIDEECGLESGGLQFTVAWETEADIGLIIESPYGTLDRRYPSSGPEIHGGGRRDGWTLKSQFDGKGSCACKPEYDSKRNLTGCGRGCSLEYGACWSDDPKQYVENIYLSRDEAPSGRYKIEFVNDGCTSPQTAVTLTVSANGKTLGTYKSGKLGRQSSEYPIVWVNVP